MPKCQYPLGIEANDLLAQMPNKEYNRENNNIYAQNGVQPRKFSSR